MSADSLTSKWERWGKERKIERGREREKERRKEGRKVSGAKQYKRGGATYLHGPKKWHKRVRDIGSRDSSTISS